MQQFQNGPPSGTIQQVVNPGSVEELGKNSSLSAWGEKRGDRLIADVVLYSGPAVFKPSVPQ
jgi:hypothetical protein